MTSQTFNLDLIPQGVPPIIHVSQYDKGQTWEIHLHENGIVFPVPANTSAAIQGTKPDSTGFQFPAVITAGDNVVMFTLEQQITVFSGDIDCELVLVNGDDQVATINFILSVEPTTLDDDTVISETQLPLIEQAAELGAVINNYATQIHNDAETASAAADAATSAAESTAADAATATAAADDAQASQTAAATSASNAATSETNAAASATAAASSASSAAQEATNAAASATAAQAAIATDMTGATASTAGAHGLVPAPSAGDNAKFLRGDGTWEDVPAELRGLTDVVLNNPADGQLLRYDATEQKWKNYTPDSQYYSESVTLLNENVTGNYTFTAPDDGLYLILVMATNNMVSSNFYMLLGTSVVAHQYFGYIYQRLNAWLPLKKGAVLGLFPHAQSDAYVLNITRLST
jgi:hypothetical protein